MKKVKKISLLLALVASLASCNNNNGGTSRGKTFYTVDFNNYLQLPSPLEQGLPPQYEPLPFVEQILPLNNPVLQ